ncbi:hypothetical protein T11_9270 [Trichinella zimbabwensis]|uniref:Uncharacterized protein n=1 Tax=Trichinella zimbabwensis TaxID=268475 RepID=A0A0V1EI54_9BILA|nr:hypothetical protein T11_9270 [Trichinella zimbabwensis]
MRRRRREFHIGIVQASWKNRTRLMTAGRTAKLPYLDDE